MKKIYAALLSALLSWSIFALQADASLTKASKISNSLAGRKTASGKPYSPHQLTAASKTLPLGSTAKVKNRKNGKTTTVKITDRGPFVRGRGIDLSQAAAKKIGLKGVAPVDVKKIAGGHNHQIASSRHTHRTGRGAALARRQAHGRAI